MDNEKNIFIEYLKFIAAILITNSHLNAFEPSYIFATGGALGDVVFLFCSGYTLFLGNFDRFDNWYKRRLMRIFPPVLCWGLLSCIFFSNNENMVSLLLNGGGWFVQCILIYYIAAYFIRKYAIDHLFKILLAILIVSIVWFIKLDKDVDFNMYGWNYCKWMIFFLVFILGAICSKNNILQLNKYSTSRAALILLLTTILWYSILYIQQFYDLRVECQIISIIPLCYFPIALYNFVASKKIQLILKRKYISLIVLGIGGLCYEIYLVQSILLHKVQNHFPLPFSIFYIVIVILIWAYILQVFSRFCLQTFSRDIYQWQKIFQIW